MTDLSPREEKIEVAQADRLAYLSLNNLPQEYRDYVLAGEWDHVTSVQAFARHRQAAEAAAIEVDRASLIAWIRSYAAGGGLTAT